MRQAGIIAKLLEVIRDGKQQAARGIHLAMALSGASLPSPSHARSCRKRHEEAARNYERVETNLRGSVNVLRYFCRSPRAEARPEAAAAEGAAAEG